MSGSMGDTLKNSSPHQTHGLYRILGHARVYSILQDLVSSQQRRKEFLSRYVGSLHSLHIADVGCGPGTITGLLPPDCIYVGIDVNLDYIQAAKRMYPDRIFLHGDVRALSDSSQLVMGSFDRVLAFSLLHHLDDDEAISFLRQAARLLRPEGFLLTVDGTITKPQNIIARWLIKHDRGAMVRTPEGYEELLSSVFITCRPEVRTDLLRIPYTHYICKASNPREF
jgi:SAM-dependent methyltransferase